MNRASLLGCFFFLNGFEHWRQEGEWQGQIKLIDTGLKELEMALFVSTVTQSEELGNNVNVLTPFLLNVQWLSRALDANAISLPTKPHGP